jgi:hypothetical protein
MGFSFFRLVTAPVSDVAPTPNVALARSAPPLAAARPTAVRSTGSAGDEDPSAVFCGFSDFPLLPALAFLVPAASSDEVCFVLSLFIRGAPLRDAKHAKCYLRRTP